MILDKVPMEDRDGFDGFSFAGRVALLAGTGVAAVKTYNQYNAIGDFAAGPTSSPFNRGMVDTFMKFAKENNLDTGFQSRVEDKLGLTKNFGKGIREDLYQAAFKNINVAIDSPGALTSKLDQLRKFTGSGARNFDSQTADLLQQVVERYGSKMSGLSFSVNEMGDIGAIDLNFGKGKSLRLNPTSSLGQAYGGKALSTVYSVGSFMKVDDAGNPRILGSASYALDTLLNAKSIDDVNFGELKDNLERLKQYDSDERAITGSFARKAEDLNAIQVRKAGQIIPAPTLNTRNREAINLLRKKMDGVWGTENNTAKGIFYVDTETRFTPVKTLPGLNESINSAQIHRTAQISDMKGLPDINENVMWGKETMRSGEIIDANNNLMKMNILSITDKKQKQRFIEELQKLGVPIDQLTDEGIILDSNIRGRIASGSGSLNLSSEKLSSTMESMMAMVAADKGISVEELARRAAAGKVDASYFKNVNFETAVNAMVQSEVEELELLQRSKRIARANKEKKKAQEYAKLIREQKTKLRELKKEARILGMSPDGRKIQEMTMRMQGVTIQGMSYDPRQKQMKFIFNRINESIGKLKLYSGEGNLKRESEYAADINTAAKNAGIDLKKNVQGVIFGEAIEMSDQKLSRSAAQTIVSMSENILGKSKLTSADKKAVQVLEKFGLKKGQAVNPADLADFDWRDLYTQIGEAYGETTPEGKIKKALAMAKAEGDGFYTSTHLLGLGEDKKDLGVGKRGSLSARQLFGLSAMGLDDFTQDLLKRRMDGGLAIAQISELKKMEELAKAKDAVVIGKDSKEMDLIRELFRPGGEEQTYDEFMEKRTRIFKDLERRGLTTDGRLVVDLGSEFQNKKIVISNSDLLRDYIGIKHGTHGGSKSLTMLDFVISKLLGDTMNQGVMEDWINRYDKEMSVIKENFNKSLGKSKIDDSMYGKFEGFKQGMSDYLKAEGIKGNAIFMTDEDIFERFGEVGVNRARRGQLFGMLGREPAESIFSSAATRIISTSVLDDKLAKEIAKNSNRGTIFIDMNASLLKAMFGDFDGDKGVVMPFLGKGSQLKDFVEMNKKTKAGRVGAMLFEYQEVLARGASILKGRSGVTDFEMGQTTKEFFNEMAARTGKGNIGNFSNRMSQIHAALRADLIDGGGFIGAGTEAAERFMKAEATTHMFIENIIKAKHMDLAAMTDEKATFLMDALTGDRVNMDVAQRARAVEGFFDELVFGELNNVYQNLDEKIKLDTSQTKMILMDALIGEGTSADEMMEASAKIDEMLEFKKSFSNIDNLEYIVNMSDAGKRLGKTTDELDSIGDMLYQAMKGNDLDDLAKKELMDVRKTNISNLAGTFMKNFGMNALLPMAGIGLAASIIGGPNEMEIAGQERAPVSMKANNGNQYQMSNAPRYRRPEVRGTMNGGSEQFLNIMNQQYGQGNIHIADHRSNMDKYEIDEIVQRGY